jgi:hypothetical protein
MNDIKVNEYLTWEYCTDPDIQYLNCPAPTAMRNHMPDWFKNLKAKKPEILLGDGSGKPFAENQTVRNCLGFRGLATVGFTIPLPETLDGYDTYFSRGRLHPEMLSGTVWANKPGGTWLQFDGSIDYSPYEYCIKLLHWPWRARMAPGWRLLILPYLLDWTNDWNEFAGLVDPNYDIQNKTSIGSGLKWTQSIDIKYNYYNLETVIAYKRSVTVTQGTVTFCAVPLYDPDLKEKQIEMDS